MCVSRGRQVMSPVFPEIALSYHSPTRRGKYRTVRPRSVHYSVKCNGAWNVREIMRWLILIGGILGLLGCVPLPEQPGEAQPYALLVLPDAIRPLTLDTQTFDPRGRIRAIRVTPGFHSLRFTYAGSSAPHVGQQAAPFRLEAQAGYQYLFEAKT